MGLGDKIRTRQRKNSLNADATVLSVQLTRLGARQTEKRDQAHVIRLSFPGIGQDPYRTTVTCGVPWNRRPLVGGKVPVIVSARDPLKVSIDWDRMPDLVDQAHAAAEATQREDACAVAEAFGFRAVSPQPRCPPETWGTSRESPDGHLSD